MVGGTPLRDTRLQWRNKNGPVMHEINRIDLQMRLTQVLMVGGTPLRTISFSFASLLLSRFFSM